MPTPRQLLADGRAEECLRCGGISAYAWGDVDGQEEVAHISCSSAWEWQCGHCGAHHVERNSPILHPAYTHADPDAPDA